MSNFMRRIFAYFIDILVVSLIVQLLSGVTWINKDLNNYNKYYKRYTDDTNEYVSIKSDFTSYYKDNKIDDEEYAKLIGYSDYKDIISKYYDDNKISSKELSLINKEIDSKFNLLYKKDYYNIERHSIYYFVIYIVAIIGYFVIFNKVTDGCTLGKRITKLRIISADNGNVSMLQLFIRSLFLYQFVYYIFRLIVINFMDINSYYSATSFVSNIQLFLEVAILMMISIRADGRGIHDLLAKTRVVRVDREGNIVEDKKSLVRKKLKDE